MERELSDEWSSTAISSQFVKLWFWMEERQSDKKGAAFFTGIRMEISSLMIKKEKRWQTCKPGSVSHQRQDLYHLSGTAVTDCLNRPTPRKYERAAHWAMPFPVYMVFQPTRFTQLLGSLPKLVVSYTTFSPFSRPKSGCLNLCSTFCFYSLRLIRGSTEEPSFSEVRCPVLPGLSLFRSKCETR